MSEFCFKILTGDRVKYVCIEAADQESADARTGVLNAEGQIERIENKDIPSDVKWSVLMKIIPAWESQYYAANG
jgi:hypothetical protein